MSQFTKSPPTINVLKVRHNIIYCNMGHVIDLYSFSSWSNIRVSDYMGLEFATTRMSDGSCRSQPDTTHHCI